MSLPNFFLIGAAKAGTTSFFGFLTQHPEVYGPALKEPNYFALGGAPAAFKGPGDDATVNRLSVHDGAAYEELFRGAGRAAAVGEASTLYLYAPEAPAAIRRQAADARLIVILRNPVERAYSAFLHLRRDQREPLADFAAALAREEARIAAGWQHLWHYRRAGLYSEQLGRYLEHFPRERLLIHLYDDLVSRPGDLLRETFRFLGVDADFEPDVSRRANVAGQPRSKLLHRILIGQNPIKSLAKRLVPERPRRRLWALLFGRNIRRGRPPMPADARAGLEEYFRPEVDRLSSLLGHDLSGWR